MNISFQIGPFRVSLIQLLVIALGVALGLGLRNQLVKRGISKGIAFVAVLPIFIIFAIIAFFRVSELPLIPFLAKTIQTHILDETKKYQTCITPIDPIEVAIARSKLNEPEQNKSEQKSLQLNDLESAKNSNILDN